MFSDEQFSALYAILELDMVESDCGVRCGKFCACVGEGQTDNAFKYLLPGEAEFLVKHGFHHNAVLEDYGFLIHFCAINPADCACQSARNYRPFCCRMFPFRPVIDGSKVIELIKAKNEKFSPCWVTEPLPAWRVRAIDAWNFVLADRTNRQFYAQYYYCLKQSETSGSSFFQALEEDEIFNRKINSLANMPDGQLWQICGQFFSYI